MFVALSLQILGLTMASLPTELRRQHGVFLLSAAWTAICFGIIAVIVVVLPAYDLSFMGKDRLSYESAYEGAIDGYSPDFEIVFSLITDLFAAVTDNSSAYFLTVFLGTVVLLHVLVSYLFRPGDWIVVYFCYFNYFAFFNCILNVIRQGLGLALCCVAIVYFLKDRLRLSCLLIVLASLIHSACIFSFAIFLARIPGATVWRLVAAVFAVFALSRAGVTEFVFDAFLNLTGIYPKHLIDYTSGGAWREYSGGIYRIDFLMFSLLPLIPYASFVWRGDVHREYSNFILYEKLTKTYVTLIIPFAFFSYMTFSDRYALQSWILMPIMVIWPLLYMKQPQSRMTWVIRTFLLTLVAVVPNIIPYLAATLLRVCEEIM